MDIMDFVSILCTILSAIFAGVTFKIYKKTLNISNIYNNKKIYKKNIQNSGNKGKNVMGDNNN